MGEKYPRGGAACQANAWLNVQDFYMRKEQDNEMRLTLSRKSRNELSAFNSVVKKPKSVKCI